MRKVSSVTLAVVWLAFAVAAPAAAVDDAVPPNVTAWFTDEAGSVAGDVLVSSAVTVDGAQRPAPGAYAAGDPVALHTWSPDFVDGDSAEVVTTTAEWVAPLLRDGAVVGTIAATTVGDGSVRLSYVDDDVVAGRALAAGIEGDVVADVQVGGLIEVANDGEAVGLSRAAQDPVAEVSNVDELREAIGMAHDPAGAAPGAEGAGVRTLVTAQPAIGAGLVAAGVAVWAVGRRRRHDRGEVAVS